MLILSPSVIHVLGVIMWKLLLQVLFRRKIYNRMSKKSKDWKTFNTIYYVDLKPFSTLPVCFNIFVQFVCGLVAQPKFEFILLYENYFNRCEYSESTCKRFWIQWYRKDIFKTPRIILPLKYALCLTGWIFKCCLDSVNSRRNTSWRIWCYIKVKSIYSVS